jgi:hypothetical protein
MREKYSVHLALATGCLIFLVTTLFALLQSPEILSTPVAKGAAMPHPLAEHQQCDQCHGHTGMIPYPLRHTGWNNAGCTKCHAPPAIPAGPSTTADSGDAAATPAADEAGK